MFDELEHPGTDAHRKMVGLLKTLGEDGRRVPAAVAHMSTTSTDRARS